MEGKWKVVDRSDGKVRVLKEGDEQECREAFDQARVDGTTGILTLVDPMGGIGGKLDAREASIERSFIPGKHIREVEVPLPPELQAIARQMALQKQRDQQQSKSTERPIEDTQPQTEPRGLVGKIIGKVTGFLQRRRT
jgi:hypothetical protein